MYPFRSVCWTRDSRRHHSEGMSPLQEEPLALALGSRRGFRVMVYTFLFAFQVKGRWAQTAVARATWELEVMSYLALASPAGQLGTRCLQIVSGAWASAWRRPLETRDLAG